MDLYRKSLLAMSVTLALIVMAPSNAFYAKSNGSPQLAQTHTVSDTHHIA